MALLAPDAKDIRRHGGTRPRNGVWPEKVSDRDRRERCVSVPRAGAGRDLRDACRHTGQRRSAPGGWCATRCADGDSRRSAEDAELVVSEIVTNVGEGDRAGRRRNRAWACPPDLAPVQVRILLFPAAVIIEVRDRDPDRASSAARRPPIRRAAGGSPIVAALCTRWHYFPSSARRQSGLGRTGDHARDGQRGRHAGPAATGTMYRDGHRQPRSSRP